MTPEQHDLVIDLLFKRINMQGEIAALWPGGEGVEAGWMRPDQAGLKSKKKMEHPNPFHDENPAN